MKRGDLYRVSKATAFDPKNHRVFVIISRNALITSQFSSVVCAPVYSNYHGISTQVVVDETDGLKHLSSIHCDALVSISKKKLTDFVGSLSPQRMRHLNKSLAIAVGLL